MNKLKVCFLIAGFGQGGAQKQCILLLNELQRRDDIELHLIYSYEDINFPELDQKNIYLYKVDINSAYDPRNIGKIGQILKEISPDIAFSWLQAFDVYMFFSRKYVPNCKWIVAERDSHYPFDFRFLLRRVLCSHADMIICNSNKGRLYWLNNNVADNNLSVVSNILSIGEGKVVDSIKGNPIVLFAGRLETQKNVVNVLSAFIRLADLYPEGVFVIVGSGSLQPNLQTMIDCSNVANQLLIFPFMKNIEDFFETADVFVNISLHEGMPNTVIENIAKNKKIVVSKIDEHISLLGHEYPFYVSNSQDVSEITDVVSAILEAKSIDEFLKHARSTLVNMDANLVAENYFSLFKKVVNV